MQSGSSIGEYAIRGNEASTALIENLGCSNATSIRTCLQAKTTEEILTGTGVIKEIMKSQFPLFTPVGDGRSGVLPDTPLNLLKDPTLQPIPTLRGFTKDDGSKVITDNTDIYFGVPPLTILLKGLETLFGQQKGKEVFQKVKRHYDFPIGIKQTDIARETTLTAIKVVTDILFIYPVIREAILYSRKDGTTKAPTYIYRFDRPPYYHYYVLYHLIRHGDDDGYFLNLPMGPDQLKFTGSNGKDVKLADFVTTLVTNFAKYGNPSPTAVNDLVWTPFITENPEAPPGRCNNSTAVHTPFEPRLDYKIMKFKQFSKIAKFRMCDEMNLWASTYQEEEDKRGGDHV